MKTMSQNVGNRIENCRQIMVDHDIDLMIATTPENISYLTGYTSISHQILRGTQVYAVANRNGEVALVAGRADLPSAIEGGFSPSQFFCYGNFQFEFRNSSSDFRVLQERFDNPASTPLEALQRACESVGRSAKKIAVDEDGVNVDRWFQINELFPAAEVVRGTGLLKQSRSIKTEWEVECLQRAAEIARDGILEVCQQFQVGMTEIDLAKIYELYVVSQGAAPFFTVISSGDRSAYADTPVTDRAIQDGDIIRFDVGCIYKGYRSDIARTAVVGTPSEKVSQYYAAIYKGLMDAVAAVRPGVAAETIFDIAVRSVQEAGIPHYKRHHVGHAIGLEVYESPTVASGATQKLEVGMTFCLETPYYELGWGGVQVEDTLVVTEDGCRLFIESPKEPYVVGGDKA
jgi:Xaa-Pro dipeptidase